jgi:septum formation protein
MVSEKEMIILASGSQRRIQILRKIGLKFKIIKSNVDEDVNCRNPISLAKKLALMKAMKVAEKVRSGIIIGADTIVVLNNEVIGKPKDKCDAKRILKKLSGRKHLVITGIAVIDARRKKAIVDFEKTEVKFRKINDKEIERYIKKERVTDKAGAYAIQGKACAFIERINGCYYNVVGLPVVKLIKILKRFNVKTI